MRTRVPADWAGDLEQRHGLERRVAAAIAAHPRMRLCDDHTDRFDRLDYLLDTTRVRRVAVELKAKWQPYRGWNQHRPDVAPADLFILDELALRRIVTTGPVSQLLVYDHPQRRWVLFGTADLILAPKARVARPISRNRELLKGKVLIDLANDGRPAGADLDAAIDALAGAIDETDRCWSRVEPWPHPRAAAS